MAVSHPAPIYSLCASEAASQRAAAAEFAELGTWVYSIEGAAQQLGWLLFKVKDMTGASFSPAGGRFKAGCVRDNVLVVDAACSAVLVRLQAAQLCRRQVAVHVHMVAWARLHGSRLHVTAGVPSGLLAGSVLFCVLQF